MLRGKKAIPTPICIVRSSLEDSMIPKSDIPRRTTLAMINPFFMIHPRSARK
jgi:hypothetical protein